MVTSFLLVVMDYRLGAHIGVENIPLEQSRPSSCLIDARLSLDGFTHTNMTFKQNGPPSIQEIAMERSNDSFHYSGLQSKYPGHPEKTTIWQQCVRQLRSLLDYSPSFWILFVLGFLLVGIVVPFNSIHTGFLQMRWYPGDALKG